MQTKIKKDSKNQFFSNNLYLFFWFNKFLRDKTPKYLIRFSTAYFINKRIITLKDLAQSLGISQNNFS